MRARWVSEYGKGPGEKQTCERREDVKMELEYATPMLGRFIGKTSCGFKHGQLYQVTIGNGRRTAKEEFVWIVDALGGRRCPYSSIAKLAENWEIPAKL